MDLNCKYLDHQLCVKSDGQYRLCCVSTESTNIENIKNFSPAEWLDGEKIRDARKKFSDGIWPEGCDTCKKKEEKGLESKRTRFKIMGPGATHLDLRFGNSCNLKCISCWPMSSSSLAEEAISMKNQGIIPIHDILKETNFNWADTDRLNELLKFPIKELYLTGGEPMMVKHLPQFLEKLDKDIVIRFNTNCTIWNKKIESILRKFKKIKMDISIDAIEQRAEYIRFGCTWKIIEENVKKYLEFCDITVTPTISVLNASYMKELKEWASSYSLPIVNNLLDNPQWLNVKNAPDKLKLIFQETNGWEQGEADIKEIQKFQENIKKLDCFRKVKIKNYLPEVAECYDLN